MCTAPYNNSQEFQRFIIVSMEYMKNYAVALTMFVVFSLCAFKASSIQNKNNSNQKGSYSFATMTREDKAVIKYISTGCFHHRFYALTFAGTSPMTVKVEQFKDNMDSENARNGKKRTTTLTLSPQDVAGLDKLFNFYRTPSKGGCTTVDKVGVAWYKNDKKEKYEYFVDETCSSDQTKALNIWGLIDRALHKK